MIISIDPGKSGAYAVFTDDGDLTETYKVKVPAGQRFFGDPQMVELFNLVASYEATEATHVVMEGLIEHRMPKQSPKATNTTAHNHGMQHAACLLAGATVSFVTPKEWKRKLGLTKDKDLSVAMARELVNEELLIKPRMRKHNVDIAEAVLIGIYYGRKELGWTI